jgi:NAD/NADP transhydrogenase alpha subunit
MAKSVNMLTVRFDRNKIVEDIITVGATLTAVITIIVNVAPQVHLPMSVTAALVSASSVIAAIVAEARRFPRSKVAMKAAMAEAPKRVAGK